MTSKKYLVTITLALALLGMAIPLQALSASEPQEDWKALKQIQLDRKKQLEEYFDRLGASVPGSNGFVREALKFFCGPGTAEDATEEWPVLKRLAKKHLRGGMASLIPAMATTAKACGYTPRSIWRAGFVLDYLYWNRIVDLTGHEVADTLTLRDAFYEHFIAQRTAEVIDYQLEAQDECMDEPETPVHPKAKLMIAVGKAVNLLDKNAQKSVEETANVLDLRKGSIVIFRKDMERLLQNPDDLRVMREVHLYVRKLQQNPKLLGERHGGWKEFMRITNNNPEQAIRVLGILASMRHWPLSEISRHLSDQGKFTTEQLRALQEGALDYYLLNQLDERAAPVASDGHSVEYHFFYPPGYTTKDWKIYHWYSNGYIGCQLAKKGLPRKYARYAAKKLAQTYELITVNLNHPARSALELDPRAGSIVEGFDDVEINTEGADWGAKFCGAR